MKQILLILSIALTFSQTLLQSSTDVHEVMESIFEQHLTTKEMSPDLMQKSVKNFILAFDPLRTFLLQNEVEPYLSLSHSQLSKVVNAYNNGNFPLFNQLMNLFHKAMIRNQKFRSSFQQKYPTLNLQDLNSLVETYKKIISKHNTQEFASSMQELNERAVTYLLTFLHQAHSQDAHATNNIHLESYLNKLREKEDFYASLTNGIHSQDQEDKLNLLILKAMTAALDSHSLIFSDLEARDMEMRLQTEFKGVGIVFSDSSDGAFVESILPNSPVSRSNAVKNGDRLLKVNDIDVSLFPFQKAMKALRESDDNISLTFEDTLGAKYTIHITKTVIALEQERLKFSTIQEGNQRFGIIQLHSFYDNFKGTATSSDLISALQTMSSAGSLDGIVLDLRQNTGGYLKQAVLTSGLFISNGVIAISKYSNGEEVILRDVDPNDYFDGPLVILTSKISASAAEIVAQALQDYGVAIIVGDNKTFGKGTIQIQNVTHKMSNRLPQLKITVGQYYTVSGKSTQLVGVIPDIHVPSFLEKESIGEEFSPNPVPSSQINPFYLDPLDDVYGPHKRWFIENYLPTIQLKERQWRRLIPILQRNSAYRLEKSQQYQQFLADPSQYSTFEDILDQPIEKALDKDLQLQEAIYILNDMSNLSKKY